MAITTTIASHYAWRLIIVGVLCAVFSLWGAYDLWVTIPAQEERYEQYKELNDRQAELRESGALSQAQVEEFLRNEARLKEVAPGGEAPIAPSKLNRATQWAYISCILATPWCFMRVASVRRRRYRLDDGGTLHFEGDPQLGSGSWSTAEISDIDMSRWMAKSIAHVVHVEGRRLKLDAYMHKHLELIVGAIAARLHPEQWNADGTPVKSTPEAGEPPGPAQAQQTVAAD